MRTMLNNVLPYCATEPMTLGSPTTTSNSLASEHLTGVQYYPGFLMGENIQLSSHITTSPPAEPRIQQSTAYVSPIRNINQHVQTRYGNQQIDEIGRCLNSPPTQSMWSALNTGPGSRLKSSLDNCKGIKHSTPNAANGALFPSNTKRVLGNDSPFLSPSVPPLNRTQLQNQTNSIASPLARFTDTSLDSNQAQSVHFSNVFTQDRPAGSFFNQNSCDDESTNAQQYWITVFGFPSHRAGFILSQFSQFGTVEKYIITNNGNWMHLKYQNKMQARCAINRNGKVFGDNIMVGVAQCTDPQIYMDNDGLDSSQLLNSDRRLSVDAGGDGNKMSLKLTDPKRVLREKQINRSSLNDRAMFNNSNLAQTSNTLDKPSCTIGRHNSMRSLAASTRSSHLSRTSSVRQDKESGLLSKALGYMFGWS